MKISGNVVLVTGGASGLGGATAQMVVDGGGKVLIADVKAEVGAKHAAQLGASARFVRCDVTSEADAKAAVEAAQSMGRLAGLVNCAGIGPAAKTVGKDGPHPLDMFAKVIGINLIGTFNMIRIVAAAMTAQDSTRLDDSTETASPFFNPMARNRAISRAEASASSA